MDHVNTPVNVTHNLLHPMTSFVGRKQEIIDIIQRLNNPLCQLLTFVGPGGIGKTRLALEVAHQISHTYRDGAYFIPLQPLPSAAHIPSTIVHMLDLPIRNHEDPLQRLKDYLSKHQLLLILDNFEHLIEDAELVSTLLLDAPDIRILVTSREPLNLYEEWQWVVKGLHFPLSVADESDEEYSAICLFAERVAQINPEFSLAEHHAVVTRICQLLEGIPLAIEMAANWTKSLTCEAIAEAIQHNIDFLTSREQNIPERHRSMRAVYNHSWRLLHEDERQVFERLSIFRSGFTVEAAEQVAGATLVMLASLMDKSFLRQDANGRYDMHELLRQYGAEQLANSGGMAAVAEQHALYFAQFLKQKEPQLKGEGQLIALNTINADFENIRAAWIYAVAQYRYERIDSMLDSLYCFGHFWSRLGDIRPLFEMALKAFEVPTETLPHPVIARLWLRNSHSADLATMDRALAIARSYGNEAEVAYCLLQRGLYDTNQRHPHAFSELQSALDIYRRIDDDYGIAIVLGTMNYHLLTFGDSTSIQAHFEQAFQQAYKIGSPWHIYQVLFRRGWSACFDGHYDVSQHDLDEALAIAHRMGFRTMEADCIGSLAFLAFLRGDFQQAKLWITHDLETVTQIKAAGEQGFAKIVLAHILCVEGNDSDAQQLALEALILVKPHPVRERFIARVLALAACSLGNFDKAREQAHWALAENSCAGIRLWILPVFACLLAHDGDLEHAAGLLGLIFTHPASATGWLKKWAPINTLQAQLANQLGAEAYADAWQQGTTLDLDTVVDDLLMITDDHAKQPLLEPLTDREMEVLRFIADGLTNHEIAEMLTVVEGTIRTHVYNLCQKLGVRNRTSAVARARALHILH